jgi:hypothetical protein
MGYWEELWVPSAGPARRSFQVNPKDVFTESGNRILSLKAEEAEDQMVCMAQEIRQESNPMIRQEEGANHVSGSSPPPIFSVNDILLFVLSCGEV